jgi:peptidoglycan/xylan/chitin deacetylase (PgdA/CDA1 family)
VDSIPILMYHQVTPQPHPAFQKYALTPRMFAAQMRWLKLAGYVPITFDRLLDGWASRAALPARAVIITFDDGFQDCVDYAVPILRQHSFTAMFYLVAGLAGARSEWLAARGLAYQLLDWPTARQLEATGFACGSHTLTHPHLAALGPAECRAELRDSRARLEHQLGHAIRDLAYPFGSFDADVRAIAAEAGYRTACTTTIGRSHAGDDLLALRRIPVNGTESLLDFVSRLYTTRTSGELRGDIKRRLRGERSATKC